MLKFKFQRYEKFEVVTKSSRLGVCKNSLLPRIAMTMNRRRVKCGSA